MSDIGRGQGARRVTAPEDVPYQMRVPRRRGEIYKREDRTFDWRLIATRNGKSVATSGGQGFADRRGAREAFLREFPGVPFEYLVGE